MSSRLPRELVVALGLVQSIALMMTFRSLALGRLTTVVMALALLVGANAALRERTWGIGAVLAASVAFPTAVWLGFAPAWFVVVGVVGFVPFALTIRSMLRFDVGAATLFGLLATGAGVAGAFAWRQAAYAMFFALHHHAHHARHFCHGH